MRKPDPQRQRTPMGVIASGVIESLTGTSTKDGRIITAQESHSSFNISVIGSLLLITLATL